MGLHPGVHVDTPGACRKFQLVAPSENMRVTNMAMSEIHGGSGLGQAVGNMVDMTVSLGRLLMGGVCERFPNLRILGDDRIIWASDYPHPEYHSGILDELREWVEPLPEASRARILGQNAVDAYGLPL